MTLMVIAIALLTAIKEGISPLISLECKITPAISVQLNQIFLWGLHIPLSRVLYSHNHSKNSKYQSIILLKLLKTKPRKNKTILSLLPPYYFIKLLHLEIVKNSSMITARPFFPMILPSNVIMTFQKLLAAMIGV